MNTEPLLFLFIYLSDRSISQPIYLNSETHNHPLKDTKIMKIMLLIPRSSISPALSASWKSIRCYRSLLLLRFANLVAYSIKEASWGDKNGPLITRIFWWQRRPTELFFSLILGPLDSWYRIEKRGHWSSWIVDGMTPEPTWIWVRDIYLFSEWGFGNVLETLLI